MPRKPGLRAAIRRRGFGLAAVLGAGILLTLLLLVQTLVGAVVGPNKADFLDPLWAVAGAVGSAALGAAFLAVLFKFSPETEVEWADVWLSAVLTMVLLSLSAHGYGWYVIPVVGTYIGGAVPVLLAAAFVNLTAAIIVLGYVLVYQQVENYWLSPKLSEKTMTLSGGVAFGAALAGGAIAGPMGAFTALPVAALITSFMSNYLESREVFYHTPEKTPDGEPKKSRRSRRKSKAATEPAAADD